MSNKKYKVRCSSNGVINLPKEVFKKIGWKINEEVHVIETKTIFHNDETFKGLTVQKVSDTEREDYQETLSESIMDGHCNEEAEA